MNRLTYLLVSSGLSVTLLAGCDLGRPSLKERRTKRTEAAKEQRTAAAAAAAAAKSSSKSSRSVKAPQPKPVITPGSVKYLDYMGGFRDVVLGLKKSSFTNLVLKTQDDQRELMTFTRPDEELSLGGIPLEGIEYKFFKGQLYQILVKWRVEQKDPVPGTPPVVTLAPFCASLYGPPRRRVINKDGTELRWSGRRVELTLSESVIHGVRDSLKGGWAIPPGASGQMVMDKIDLRKAVTAMLASSTEARKDGL